MKEADLVNVSNQHDLATLKRRGIAAEKIIVLPFGLSATRRAALESNAVEAPKRPTVLFVGSF